MIWPSFGFCMFYPFRKWNKIMQAVKISESRLNGAYNMLPIPLYQIFSTAGNWPLTCPLRVDLYRCFSSNWMNGYAADYCATQCWAVACHCGSWPQLKCLYIRSVLFRRIALYCHLAWLTVNSLDNIIRKERVKLDI